MTSGPTVRRAFYCSGIDEFVKQRNNEPIETNNAPEGKTMALFGRTFDAAAKARIAAYEASLATETPAEWNLDLEDAAPVAAVTRTASKVTVTMPNGDKASRSTTNVYAAFVVGYKAGKLSILSAHWDAQAARDTIAKHKAGQFVNFNYRNKLDGEAIVVTA